MNNNAGPPPKPINILIADDHKLLRESLQLFFSTNQKFKVVGQASNGHEVIQLAGELKPDIILMDINMAPINGFEATEAIMKLNPASKIIAVSMNAAPAHIKRIMQLGGMGYVSKDSSSEELTTAIIEVSNGRNYFCRKSKDSLADNVIKFQASGIDLLSEREKAIIQFIKQGQSSGEIAEKLDMNKRTVEVHRYNILKKLKLKNRAALVNFCNEHGI